MRSSIPVWILFVGVTALGVCLVLPRVGGSASARETAARADIQGGIKTALDLYKDDTGNFPRYLADLSQKPKEATNWHGPYLEKVPVDPWGDPYVYQNPGRHKSRSYDLFSDGPDGKPGTRDDIVNWQDN